MCIGTWLRTACPNPMPMSCSPCPRWTRTALAERCEIGTAPRWWSAGANAGSSLPMSAWPNSTSTLALTIASLEAQGIALEPQSQIGAPAKRIEVRGIEGEGLEADRAEMHREIARNNG